MNSSDEPYEWVNRGGLHIQMDPDELIEIRFGDQSAFVHIVGHNRRPRKGGHAYVIVKAPKAVAVKRRRYQIVEKPEGMLP